MLNRKVLHFCFFVCLEAILIQSCTPKSDAKLSYWENGNLKSELRYEGDQLNGKCVWFYETGIPQLEVNYVLNQKEGISQRWHENGQLEMTCWYKNNLQDSLCFHYDLEGHKISQEYFVKDTVDGPFYKWYENGQLMIEGAYSMGMMDGSWLMYYFDGLVSSKADFVKGKGIQKGYHINGVEKVIYHYKNNLKHGKQYYFDETGKQLKVEIYDEGELIGEEK